MANEFIARNGLIAQESSEISGSLKIKDSASTFNILGNIFGQTYLQSPNGALVLNPGYGGVNINGANPNLKVDGTITSEGNALIKTALIGTISAFGDNYSSFSHTSRAETNSYSILSDNVGATYLNASSNQNIKFRIDNTDKAILDSNGNFGIGTTTPNSKLDVNGNVIVTGSLTVTQGITGSLFGTASRANVANAVNVSDNTDYGGSTFYPVFSSNTTGTTSLNVDSQTFTYNPATNILTTTASVASSIGTLTQDVLIQKSSPTLTLNTLSGGSATIILTSNTTGNREAVISSTLSTGDLVLKVAGSERYRIKYDGIHILSSSQVQITGSLSVNGKVTATDLNATNQTASTIASFDASKNVVSLATATYPSLTELSLVKGVAGSSIQTQLDNKIAKNVSLSYTTNTITTLSAADYAAIGTKDATTLYFII